jgi:hypothetical protein
MRGANRVGKQGWTVATLSKLKNAELKHALAWRHALPKKPASRDVRSRR